MQDLDLTIILMTKTRSLFPYHTIIPTQENDIIQQNADVTNILGNAMYMVNSSNGLNYGFTLTYSNLNYALGNTTLIGPSAQMSKDWIKEKWSSSFSASFFPEMLIK